MGRKLEIYIDWIPGAGYVFVNTQADWIQRAVELPTMTEGVKRYRVRVELPEPEVDKELEHDGVEEVKRDGQ